MSGIYPLVLQCYGSTGNLLRARSLRINNAPSACCRSRLSPHIVVPYCHLAHALATYYRCWRGQLFGITTSFFNLFLALVFTSASTRQASVAGLGISCARWRRGPPRDSEGGALGPDRIGSAAAARGVWRPQVPHKHAPQEKHQCNS